MEFSKDLGLPDIIMEGDSLQVVQALRELGPNLRPYEQIVDDARVVLGLHRSWMVYHVKREANSAAHYLAKFALLCSTKKI